MKIDHAVGELAMALGLEVVSAVRSVGHRLGEQGWGVGLISFSSRGKEGVCERLARPRLC